MDKRANDDINEILAGARVPKRQRPLVLASLQDVFDSYRRRLQALSSERRQIENALRGEMTEEAIVTRFREAQETSQATGEQVLNHFMPLVREALARKDKEGAMALVRRCPDPVTASFMLDAIRQSDPATAL